MLQAGTRGLIDTTTALRLHNNTKFDNLAKAFRYNDKDHNGFLSKEELRAVCYEYNVPVTVEMIDDLFLAVDPSGQGKVDFASFSKFFDWRAQNVEDMPSASHLTNQGDALSKVCSSQRFGIKRPELVVLESAVDVHRVTGSKRASDLHFKFSASP
jgi:hypothetical protein